MALTDEQKLTIDVVEEFITEREFTATRFKECLAEIQKLKLHKYNAAEFFAEMKPENIETLKELYGNSQLEAMQLTAAFNAQVERCGNDFLGKRFPEIEDHFEEIEEKIMFIENKKFKGRKKYMEFVQKIMDFLGQHPEVIATAGLKMSDYAIAAKQIEAGKPDLNNDGRVTKIEQAVYNIAKMPWQEWMLILLGIAGAFFGGIYVGGL